MTLCETVKELWNKSKTYVNYKLGSVSGGALGAYVYWANSDHGIILASEAALKQFLLSVLLGGSVIKIGQYAAIKPKNNFLGYTVGVIVPSTLASAIVFSIHYFTGTPESYLSTLPYPVLAVLATTPVSYFTRKGYLKEEHERTRLENMFGI